VTRGFSFISNDNGWPMPPAPPNTLTFDAYQVLLASSELWSGWTWQLLEIRLLGCLTCLAEAEKALLWQALKICREAIMMGRIFTKKPYKMRFRRKG